MGSRQSNQHLGASIEHASSNHSGPEPSRDSCNCILTFEENCVRVVATQPEDLKIEEKQANASAFMLCWQHLSLHPTKNFEIKMLGGSREPKYELLIERSLVDKLPLLHDVATNSDSAGTATPMQLTSSIWGLVSLLVLLESDMTAQQWFEGAASHNPIASLPGQTLEVACFLGCSSVKRDVVAWLQQVLTQLVHAYSGGESDNSNDNPAMHTFPATWEITEAFRWATMLAAEPVVKEIMEILTADSSPSEVAQTVVHLPQDLLCRWLDCLAPVLDLRASTLPSIDLTRLLACLPMTAGSSFQELQLPLSCESDCVSPPELLNLSHGAFGYCSARAHNNSNRSCVPTHISLGAICPSCGSVTAALVDAPVVSLAQARNDAMIIRRLHKHAMTSKDSSGHAVSCGSCNRSIQIATVTHLVYGIICQRLVATSNTACGQFTVAIDYPHHPLPHLKEVQPQNPSSCMRILATVGGFARNMTSLKHLGLHNIPLNLGTVQNLGQLLGSLPHSTTTLTLGILSGDVTVTVKVLLCKAIARMRSLRQLCIPQWEEVIGADAVACMMPLKSLPHLEAVVVRTVRKSNAFPAGIHFQSIS